MKLKIAGSGGMFQIPNPFCKCPICEEARIKRGRYERLGPSLYIEDIHMPVSYTHLDYHRQIGRRNKSRDGIFYHG